MILSIEFLQDIPIPQKGTSSSRKFFASEGWGIEVMEDRVRLTRPGGAFSTTVAGVPFLLHEDALAPLGAREEDSAPPPGLLASGEATMPGGASLLAASIEPKKLSKTGRKRS